MATLFISAPYWKAAPGLPGSFEDICKTGIGPRYAIWKKWAVKITPGWSVVLLRSNNTKNALKGFLLN